MSMTLSRRRFLNALGAGATTLPAVTLPGFVQAAGLNPAGGNILVLVELAGGNDGLNTVIPVRDPAYRALRPEIAIDGRAALTLDSDTALHPDMRQMADLWEQGDVRIVEGVGYPNPNRSHFRSIEIWNAGLGADSQEQEGWVAQAFGTGGPAAMDAQGLTLGGEMGPLSGQGRFSALRDEESFLYTIENLPGGLHPVRPVEATSPLAHVMATYESAQITGDLIRARLMASRDRQWAFPGTELGEQLRTAARLLDAGADVPVLKVVQTGYDTHEAQPDAHSYLMMELSEAIGAFANAMREAGLWDRITVVTYSEFGRTARENASAGTDHGTAAPVMIAGGGVLGGFDGARPSLDQLVEDDLVHTTDYRSLYDAILADLWGMPVPRFAPAEASGLRLLG